MTVIIEAKGWGDAGGMGFYLHSYVTGLGLGSGGPYGYGKGYGEGAGAGKTRGKGITGWSRRYVL